MMKLTIFAALAGSANAFAPVQVAQTSLALSSTEAQEDFFGITKVDLSSELGSQPPVSWPVFG